MQTVSGQLVSHQNELRLGVAKSLQTPTHISLSWRCEVVPRRIHQSYWCRQLPWSLE